MNISQKGLEIIKEFEGFSASKYICSAGRQTIGYGHVLKLNENLAKISKEQAEILLKKDVASAEYVINKAVLVPLTQGQFDALVSLVYNWGGGNFLNSKGLKKLNTSNYQGAMAEFIGVNKVHGVISRGLVKRRLVEMMMFNEIA